MPPANHFPMTSYGGIIRIRSRVEVWLLPLSRLTSSPVFCFRRVLYTRRGKKARISFSFAFLPPFCQIAFTISRIMLYLYQIPQRPGEPFSALGHCPAQKEIEVMGLIKAAMGAASGVMGDQWKEYFYCDALPAEVLAVKGQKRTNGRSANRHGSENVISDGSVIAVADGQCVLIVEQGKVVDLCAEPGEYTYSTGTQPSLLSGGLKNIDSVFAELGKRFSLAGRPVPTSASTISIPGSSPQQVRHPPTRCPSGWWISAPVSISTSASGASASTATGWSTPSCFTPMSAAMWKTPTPATRWTASSRPS